MGVRGVLVGALLGPEGTGRSSSVLGVGLLGFLSWPAGFIPSHVVVVGGLVVAGCGFVV